LAAAEVAAVAEAVEVAVLWALYRELPGLTLITKLPGQQIHNMSMGTHHGMTPRS
jgi:hypothetical protein